MIQKTDVVNAAVHNIYNALRGRLRCTDVYRSEGIVTNALTLDHGLNQAASFRPSKCVFSV